MFESVARLLPDNVAVSDGQSRLTYSELDRRAGRLASALRAAGVSRDQLVGLCVERSVDLVVGLLGILKAGAGYLPLDPAYPAARRDRVLSLSNAEIVVTHRATSALVSGRKVVALDDLDASLEVASPAHAAEDASSLAYVIFTSGSSGEPKGVMIEHRHVLRLFSSTDEVFSFGPSDVWCNFHSAAFDFSVWEIWGALLYGGHLVMVSNEVARDPHAFASLLRREQVTVLNQTPSSFRNLATADAELPAGAPALALRHVIFGGERLDCRSLVPWVERHGLEKPALVNMYGITETTVHVTWKRIARADLETTGPSPIGVAISDLELDLVDDKGDWAAPGKEGVLFVSGAGLARGYLGRPELTRERFVTRVGRDGRERRWYNSGDLGVQLAPGEFGYVGRADRQIKIRGYRIEPGEIEVAIRKEPAVKDCVVIAAEFGAGDPRLVAYLVIDSGADAKDVISRVQAQLGDALPGYMGPSTYIPLAKLPTTANGKLDEDALREQLRSKMAAVSGAPGGETTGDLVRGIWTRMLGIEQIGDHDEFFDLGGTSFSLLQMLSQVNEQFNTNLRISVFGEGASISVLASALERHAASQPNQSTK
ncbi:MAG: amino acid adenylation domain-containing protein [Myxococcales bacterium]|nr:amino acid adenylation domain-containing protein [Myxococcales bacterium]